MKSDSTRLGKKVNELFCMCVQNKENNFWLQPYQNVHFRYKYDIPLCLHASVLQKQLNCGIA